MARGLFLTAPGALEFRPFTPPDPGEGEALVRVAGCGLCHTDVTFYSGDVRTRLPLPLILGHEIAGTVERASGPYAHLAGRPVIVPAVMPCGTCDLCQSGHDTACAAQIMPGNHIHGGFSSHVVVPARHLVPLGADLGGHALAELSVIADALTTPYQAVRRAGVRPGDLVIVIGIGGIGTFAVQIARALDAHVAGVDVDPERLDTARALGARWTFNPRETDARAIRKTLTSDSGVSTARWRILEMSGTAAGQELAWGLLGPAATLGVIGFTMDKPDIRLSNLMALDASAFGSWGCSPRLYREVIDLVVRGLVQIRPFIDVQPLDAAPDLFAEISRGGHRGRRAVLVPDGSSVH